MEQKEHHSLPIPPPNLGNPDITKPRLLSAPEGEEKALLYSPPGRSYGSVSGDRDEESEISSKMRAMGVDPAALEISQQHSEMVVRPLVSTPTLSRVFSKVEPGSLRGSIFTLSSSAIGAGLLSLPLVIKNLGLLLGVSLIVVGALLALQSMNMLLDTADVIFVERGPAAGGTQGRSISYSELVAETLGEKAGIVLEVTLVVYSFGTVIGYLLVIGRSIDVMCTVLHVQFPYPDNAPVVIAALATLPLALFRDISSLAMSSLLGVFSMTFVCCAVSLRGMENGNFSNIPNPLARYGSGFWSSMTIIFFAYNCHTNIFSIYSSLKYPLLSRMKKVTLRSVTLEVVLYSSVAASGYVLFKEDTLGNILQNFPADDVIITLCKGCVGLTLIMNTPLCVHPMRENLYCLVHKCKRLGNRAKEARHDADAVDLMGYSSDEEDEFKKIARQRMRRKRFEKMAPQVQDASLFWHVSVTVMTMTLAAYLGLNVPGVETVFSFLGATACLATSFVFPILMFITIIDRKFKRESAERRSLYKLACWVLLLVLVVIGVLSVIDSALALTDDEKPTASASPKVQDQLRIIEES
mmetsp:Transcript_17008/g.23793  ORF Transcript_17008/g.23793 Transcript_17008/m.23793 type:complete len:581 (-) Transcript_17008:201-1943(-)|eukprot:CAMPEP_0184499438 /NCGR_PEP_ID=MMETSP0113_2-20130426/41508_1 /TAXON_ID=91329 /ORGANISM="Norrisiella sphaerica, Strain BC52" /LENGTH=580 /DNA_ID=CAMNT_0026887353 /DNA_START=76 /DNA_END=1818 /DNA_ORIENTATION=+